MIPRFLVRGFIETTDEVLENITHLDVRNLVGVKIDLGEFRHDEKKSVRLIEFGDMLLEAKVIDDVTSTG